MEDEISSFRQQAMHVRKARRLYGLLMMKRKETLQNSLKEFRAICERLDKVQKTNKNMGIVGGTTGAVGGVTAVVGVALAPLTMGASLIATLVGAGIAASAGGFGAHAAKANKKVVNRETVEKLVNDYKSDVADLEHCLHYILCAMKELRRHNAGKMQRAGAPQDALRMADLSRAVLNNNTYSSRQTSPSPGGMTSESLLKHFVAEFDLYFTEKNGQKLKKSNKSRFSVRVCTLVTNLQEELNYLTQMWETLS
ncbi:apolipoprotein L6-like [Fundulus diaphanus]